MKYNANKEFIPIQNKAYVKKQYPPKIFKTYNNDEASKNWSGKKSGEKFTPKKQSSFVKK